MIFLLVAIILAGIIAYQLQDGYWSVVDIFMGGFTFLALGAVLLLVWGGIAIGIGAVLPHETDLYQSTPIVSMRDAIGLNGNFFLGSGSAEDKPKFYFYEKSADGGFKFNSVDADSTPVYQDEKVNPHIDHYMTGLKYGWTWLIGLWIADSYKIHIPPNSIVQNFNLNMGR